MNICSPSFRQAPSSHCIFFALLSFVRFSWFDPCIVSGTPSRKRGGSPMQNQLPFRTKFIKCIKQKKNQKNHKIKKNQKNHKINLKTVFAFLSFFFFSHCAHLPLPSSLCFSLSPLPLSLPFNVIYYLVICILLPLFLFLSEIQIIQLCIYLLSSLT